MAAATPSAFWGDLDDRRSISFQMTISASPPTAKSWRANEDCGLPKGKMVLTSLQGRLLHVIAYAYAQFLRMSSAN